MSEFQRLPLPEWMGGGAASTAPKPPDSPTTRKESKKSGKVGKDGPRSAKTRESTATLG